MREHGRVDGDGRHAGNGIEQVETVAVGGGRAGLSVGYHLARRGRPFVVLDAGERVGDSWRTRWGSLRLFTPARYDSLPGRALPASAWTLPTKDEMGEYLQAYARRFDLPVRSGAKVERLSPRGSRWVVEAGGLRLEAPRMVGTERGLPLLEDGRVLELANVVWCTGFRHDLAWAGLPEHGPEGAGLGRVVADRPGLYLVGQHFLHALSSAMVHGVERDAAFVADAIAARAGRPSDQRHRRRRAAEHAPAGEAREPAAAAPAERH